ncbi:MULTISPECIES: SH3 domain-containing protein [unclassified Streptomyces]|uniref:SH3 domain-containing protein n=1 Tax=unclassified Streptomyces TaxID=2593676 RepID=UPI003830A66D
MNRSTVRNSVVAVVAALALFPTTAMAAAPTAAPATAAVAHTHHHHHKMHVRGVVVTPRGHRLHVRTGAGLTYRTTATMRSGRKVTVVCKTYGASVRGNRVWYRLAGQHVRYVSARYVRVPATPAVPWC